jgi:serine/threonine-protein kinase
VPTVLVVRFENRPEIGPIVRAAIDVDIVYVALPVAPPSGRSTLHLYVGDELVAALSAEPVGSGRDGAYPLRVRLIDPAHADELEHYARGSSSNPPAVARPSRSPANPAVDHDDQTLEEHAKIVPERPRPPRYFTDEETRTIPGQSVPGVAGIVTASWNVRIAPTTKDPLCGRIICGGKYVLDSVIGTGAIGIVFKASHRDLGRTVAIKVLNPRYRDDPELLEVFRREARAASQLEHPNVARVYDYGQEPDGLVYIVMEYLSGYTLGSVLAARGKVTMPRAVEVMMQVCAGLTAAHDHDIVHRDVKPDNIVLVPAQDDEGRPVEIVKVCDFGIAALGTTTTEEGTAVGSPEYMPPEQTMGIPVRPSADVYACGIVLYEMLTGEVPFTDAQAFRVLMKQRSEAPRPPSSVDPAIPAALEAVVLRCMEKAPDRRFATARELRLALRQASSSERML